MIRINQVKLSPGIQGEKIEQELRKRAAAILKCDASRIKQLSIVKCSIDARKKPDIFYSYTVDVTLSCSESSIRKKLKKDSEITEDDLHNGEEKMQKITDKFIKRIEEMVEEKEQDIMAI